MSWQCTQYRPYIRPKQATIVLGRDGAGGRLGEGGGDGGECGREEEGRGDGGGG